MVRAPQLPLWGPRRKAACLFRHAPFRPEVLFMYQATLSVTNVRGQLISWPWLPDPPCISA